MIVLDTNVVSEAMRARPDVRVVKWLDDQPASSLAITSVTIAEILFGIRQLSIGRRRDGLQSAFEIFMRQGLGAQVLDFDRAAAEAYSWIVLDRRLLGRPIEAFDAMIAAVAVSRRAEVATRNVSDFEGCGVQIVNPRTWSGAAR